MQVLCTDKSENMAKYLLGEKATQIFASKYQLHLNYSQESESREKIVKERVLAIMNVGV